MRIVWAFLALLVWVTPASAEFTAAEAQQIENLRVNVVHKLAAALEQYSFAIQQDQDTLAMRRSAILQTNFAMQWALRALSRLVDVVEPAQFQVPDPATRAQRVAAAWTDLDQAVTYIDTAIGVLGPATGANMLQAKNTHLPGAKAGILALNRTLAYTDARPPSYPALVGPHGDYDRTQALIARAWNYHIDIVNGAFTAYGQGATPPTANWYVVVQKSYLNYRTFADGHAIMAGVGQSNVNQFWRILAYTRRLTDTGVDGVPVRFFNILGALNVAPHQSLAFSVTRIGESWRAADQAVWEILTFLNCDQTSDPTGCAVALP